MYHTLLVVLPMKVADAVCVSTLVMSYTIVTTDNQIQLLLNEGLVWDTIVNVRSFLIVSSDIRWLLSQDPRRW